MTVPDGPAFDFGPTATIEAWVRPRGPGIVVEQGDATSTARFVIETSASDGAMLFAGWIAQHGILWGVLGNPGNGVGHDIPFPRDTWNHLAMVQDYDGEQITTTLFVNGTPLVPSSVWHMPDNLVRGATGLPLHFCSLDGDVDEIRIWRVARTPEEIRAHMASSLPANTPDLVAYYTFDETGQIVADACALESDGTLGDSAAVEPSDPTRIAENAF